MRCFTTQHRILGAQKAGKGCGNLVCHHAVEDHIGIVTAAGNERPLPSSADNLSQFGVQELENLLATEFSREWLNDGYGATPTTKHGKPLSLETLPVVQVSLTTAFCTA